MLLDDEDGWDFEVPDVEVEYTDPTVVGVLLDHRGDVLRVVREDRPPFGFQPAPGRVPKRKKRRKKRG